MSGQKLEDWKPSVENAEEMTVAEDMLTYQSFSSVREFLEMMGAGPDEPVSITISDGGELGSEGVIVAVSGQPVGLLQEIALTAKAKENVLEFSGIQVVIKEREAQDDS